MSVIQKSDIQYVAESLNRWFVLLPCREPITFLKDLLASGIFLRNVHENVTFEGITLLR